MWLHVRSLFALWLWSSTIAPQDTMAEIYRCSTDDGRIEFTDLPCRNGVAATLSEGTGIALPALTDDETRRIETIDRDAAANRERHARESERRAREREKREAKSAALCKQATQSADELRRQRRRGYRASDDAKLSAAEARVRALAREHCK
jgi:hypothetical protein